MKRQFATFRLGDSLFGIDVLLVDEVNRQLGMVPVAGAPPFVSGLLNLRGQIVTVIDLGAKIGAGDLPITPTSRCVVLKTSRQVEGFRAQGLLDDDTSPDMVGLLVSRVEDMVSVDDSDIDPPPANVGDIAGKYIAGLVQMETGLLNILRITEVVSHEAQEEQLTS
jgi:purine-binding chemotaxis protein CheW